MTLSLRPLRLLVLSLGLAALACGGADDPTIGDEQDLKDGPALATTAADADATTSLKVRSGQLTLTISSAVAYAAKGGGTALVVHGSASRDLAAVQGFIPDDAFGDVTMLGPRTFELVLTSPSDRNTALAGARFYVELTTKTGTPTRYTAQLQLGPRLVKPAGSADLDLERAVTPVWVNGELRYRGKVNTQTQAMAMAVTTPLGGEPVVKQAGTNVWRFDWTFAGLDPALVAKAKVDAKAKFLATTLERKATLAARVVEVGLTTLPLETAWPQRTCDAKVLTCMASLPQGTTDLGRCGAYYDVARCVSEHGYPVVEKPVGSACLVDAECEGGLCWRASEHGHPGCVGGVCTKPCKTKTTCKAAATQAGASTPDAAVCAQGLCDLYSTGLGVFACDIEDDQ